MDSSIEVIETEINTSGDRRTVSQELKALPEVLYIGKVLFLK